MSQKPPKDNFMQLLDDLESWTNTVGRGPSRDELKSYTDLKLRGGELLEFLADARYCKYICRKWDDVDGKLTAVWPITQLGRDVLSGKVIREKIDRTFLIIAKASHAEEQ